MAEEKNKASPRKVRKTTHLSGGKKNYKDMIEKCRIVSWEEAREDTVPKALRLFWVMNHLIKQ